MAQVYYSYSPSIPLSERLIFQVKVSYSGDPIKAIADEIYGDLHHNHGNIESLRHKAILTPLNESVHKINREIMNRLPGNSRVYKSCDTICKGSSTYGSDEILYPPEYLNTLRFSGMPNHELKLKEGVPIMLLCNLNPKKVCVMVHDLSSHDLYLPH